MKQQATPAKSTTKYGVHGLQKNKINSLFQHRLKIQMGRWSTRLKANIRKNWLPQIFRQGNRFQLGRLLLCPNCCMTAQRYTVLTYLHSKSTIPRLNWKQNCRQRTQDLEKIYVFGKMQTWNLLRQNLIDLWKIKAYDTRR